MKEIWFHSVGDNYWRLNHALHREDGPAYEYGNGTKEWYLFGNFYCSEQDWQFALEEYNN